MRLAGRYSWAVCEVLLIGLASGCDWAEILSARLPHGFGWVARPDEVFLDGRLINHRQRKMCIKPVHFHKPGVSAQALLPIGLWQSTKASVGFRCNRSELPDCSGILGATAHVILHETADPSTNGRFDLSVGFHRNFSSGSQ